MTIIIVQPPNVAEEHVYDCSALAATQNSHDCMMPKLIAQESYSVRCAHRTSRDRYSISYQIQGKVLEICILINFNCSERDMVRRWEWDILRLTVSRNNNEYHKARFRSTSFASFTLVSLQEFSNFVLTEAQNVFCQLCH